MRHETAFSMEASGIKFGPGVTREVGHDMKHWDARRVMVVTDPYLTGKEPVLRVLEALKESGIEATLFDRVRVEPTDESFREAIEFAVEGRFDGYVAVGGGSTIDTTKAANLYATWPAEFLTYVNAPVGKGLPVPGRLKPLIAVPTTAGTGSETTGVAIFDYTPLHAKTGIAHRRLKPMLGILDPENTRSMPAQVAATSGFDVLSHAIESYTAMPFHQRQRPERPVLRPAYQGSNPISDIWSLEALRWVSKYFVRAVENPDDDEAREKMQLAASYAGVGFGNAAVHLPHGMSYPVSGMVKDFRPQGFPGTHPIVPHGMSVILNAPAVFRFTAQACPDRHLIAAQILGADTSKAKLEDAGKILSDRLGGIMQRLKVPNGLRAVGYGKADIPALVQGTLPQARVTKLSPRPVDESDLTHLFEESLQGW